MCKAKVELVICIAIVVTSVRLIMQATDRGFGADVRSQAYLLLAMSIKPRAYVTDCRRYTDFAL